MTKLFDVLIKFSKKSSLKFNLASPSLLDVGCGNGDTVYDCLSKGYEAFGTDVEFKEGPYKDHLIEEGRVKKLGSDSASRLDTIDNNNLMEYAWPFPNDTFDVVCSRATIEHVFNLNDFVIENNRVLKDSGIAIHYFPSKFALIEPHVGIPLAGLFRANFYLTLCVYLGLCFKKYKKFTKAEAVKHIKLYLDNYTCYRNEKEIIQKFESHGFVLEGRYPNVILQATEKDWAKFISKFSPLRYLFSLFRSKLLVFSKEQRLNLTSLKLAST
tara:strand:+ start:12320 stop:13129 length:810 start_codon:yes stop_codon:yes gene_type:complete